MALFLLRALRAARGDERVAWSFLSGLFLAFSLLAGSIYVPMANVLVVISAATYFAISAGGPPSADPSRVALLRRSAWVVLLVGMVSFAASSAQLLPSMEYAQLAKRWTVGWSGAFHDRIPYHITSESFRLSPQAFFSFIFGAAPVGSSEFTPYFGVFPLLLAIFGVWRNWDHPWVRYFCALGVCAFVFGMGSYSFPHGLAYLTVPFIDKLWEAGRMLYLTTFAAAVLVGFGAQSMFSSAGTPADALRQAARLLKWATLALGALLAADAARSTQQFSEWTYFTFLLLISSWGIAWKAAAGSRTSALRGLALALILCDLAAFNWVPLNRAQVEQSGINYRARMRDARPLADFFKAQPGIFRVHLEVPDDGPKSFGDVYGVQTVQGWGASMLKHYPDLMFSPIGGCLLNVRYIVASTAQVSEPVVFTSGPWKVHEVSRPCPRAWIVHQAERLGEEEILQRVRQGNFDPLRVALTLEDLESSLSTSPGGEEAVIEEYHDNWLRLRARASSPGLLVLSEMHYPGWVATVNGRPARIHRVNGQLRGVLLGAGESSIEMRYQPWTVRAGVALSLAALLATIILAVRLRWRGRRWPAAPEG